MFSTKKKIIITLIPGTLLIVFILLIITNSGANIATVVLSTNTQTYDCIQALPEGKRGLEYTAAQQRVNTDTQEDIILTAVSKEQCGSAGCTHELCLISNKGVEIISFGYAAETLIVKNTASNGMYDMQLQGSGSTNLQWNGSRYIVVQSYK
jgi:hypothetical protein